MVPKVAQKVANSVSTQSEVFFQKPISHSIIGLPLLEYLLPRPLKMAQSGNIACMHRRLGRTIRIYFTVQIEFLRVGALISW